MVTKGSASKKITAGKERDIYLHRRITLKNYLTIIFISFSVLVFSGCFALRSAEGLNEGELNVNYIAPLAASVRYGVMDNIETRYSFIGESSNYDLFLHTHMDSSIINYGITLGLNTLNHVKYNKYVGLTVGLKVNNNFSPYIAVMGGNNIVKEHFFAIGSDIKIKLFKKKEMTILLTPEVCIPNSRIANDIYKGSLLGSMNIGFIFDVYSLFK